MPKKHYRLRLRGKQRENIDVDLFTEALLMVIQEMQQADVIKADDNEEDAPEEDCS